MFCGQIRGSQKIIIGQDVCIGQKNTLYRLYHSKQADTSVDVSLKQDNNVHYVLPFCTLIHSQIHSYIFYDL